MVKTIMSKRLDYAQKIGCDGVDPDNVGADEVSHVTNRVLVDCPSGACLVYHAAGEQGQSGLLWFSRFLNACI